VIFSYHEVLVLPHHFQDGNDLLVQFNVVLGQNHSETSIITLNQEGRYQHRMVVPYPMHGNPMVIPIESGRFGYFAMYVVDLGLRIFRINSQGQIFFHWEENYFIPGSPRLPVPIFSHSVYNSSHWAGLSLFDGRPAWSIHFEGRIFLSPNWPSGNTTTEAYYGFVTPLWWAADPRRATHTLILADSGTPQLFSVSYGMAIFDSFTGRQLARSEIITISYQTSEEMQIARSQTRAILEASSKLSPANVNNWETSHQQPSCYPFSGGPDWTLDIMDDWASNSILLPLQTRNSSLLYVFNAETLETVNIINQPMPTIDCPTLFLLDTSGGNLLSSGRLNQTWIAGRVGRQSSFQQTKEQ